MPNPPELSRRSFIGAAIGAAGLLSQAGPLPAMGGTAAGENRRAGAAGVKIGKDAILNTDADDGLLRFLGQLGIEWVATHCRATQGESLSPAMVDDIVRYAAARGITKFGDGTVADAFGPGGPAGGPTGPWKEQEVRALIKRAANYGMRLGSIQLHAFPHVTLGTPERDRDIEHVLESIRIVGRLGIPVLQYSFEALRPSLDLTTRPGRGGSTYRAFDASRITDQAPFKTFGTADDEEMWDRLKYFLKAIVPVAVEAGVRLALHPGDPPVPLYHGVANPFASVEHWKRLVNFIPSPHNGVVLETGVTTEIGGNVPELIRYFGARDCINHCHFRNVRTVTPTYDYTEVFIDEGNADMLAAMKAFHEIGYSHMLVPDHSPIIAGDSKTFGAWGYALGYIKALRRAAEG